MLKKIQSAIRFAWCLTSSLDTLTVYQGVAIRVIQRGNPFGDRLAVLMYDEDDVIVFYEDLGVIIWPPEQRQKSQIPPKERRHFKDLDLWLASIDALAQARTALEGELAGLSDQDPLLLTVARKHQCRRDQVLHPDLKWIIDRQCKALMKGRVKITDVGSSLNSGSYVWGGP